MFIIGVVLMACTAALELACAISLYSQGCSLIAMRGPNWMDAIAAVGFTAWLLSLFGKGKPRIFAQLAFAVLIAPVVLESVQEFAYRAVCS